MTTNKDQKIVLKKGASGKRYPKSFKLSVLSELDSGLSRSEILLKYGMTAVTLRKWIKSLQLFRIISPPGFEYKFLIFYVLFCAPDKLDGEIIINKQ